MKKIECFWIRETDHIPFSRPIEKQIEAWIATVKPSNPEFHFVSKTLAYVVYDAKEQPEVL